MRHRWYFKLLQHPDKKSHNNLSKLVSKHEVFTFTIANWFLPKIFLHHFEGGWTKMRFLSKILEIQTFLQALKGFSS